MIEFLTPNQTKEIAKTYRKALWKLDLKLRRGGDINTDDLFYSLVRGLDKQRNLPENKRKNKSINLLGILFGQLIVWEADWLWAMYFPSPDLSQLCVTDRNKNYVVLPMDQAWHYVKKKVETLELEFRMIKESNLPPPEENSIILSPDCF
jgi:hypothetical protein